MLKRFLVLISSTAVILFTPQCSNRPGPSDEKPSPFGMVGVFDYGNTEEVADIAMDIGVEWNRLWFNYDYFVDGNGEIDPDQIALFDTIADTALEHDITLFGVVTMYGATWDNESNSVGNENNFLLYEGFLGYLVDYFRGRIDYWEISNEPEVDEFWKPAPNAAIYTKLLQRAYSKVKGINPEAQVIGLSSVSSIVDFIEEAFQNDALSYMDILALHPYCYLDPNYKSVFEISYEYSVIDDIREMMVKYHGVTKPIWVTEVGYPTYKGEFGVSEQRQAEMLVRSFMLLIEKDIPVIAWYSFLNNRFDETEKEDNFGILTNDLEPKKAFSAYRNMTAILKGYAFKKAVSLEEKCKALLFNNSEEKEILIAWTFDETPNTEDGDVVAGKKNILLSIDGEIEGIYDIYKNPLEVPSSDGAISIELSSSPLYIIGDFDSLP